MPPPREEQGKRSKKYRKKTKWEGNKDRTKERESQIKIKKYKLGKGKRNFC